MWQREAKLNACGDLELGEHLPQVVGDGVLAEKQPGTDLRVREPIAGQLGDLPLLRGQIIARLNRAPTHVLARRQQLTSGSLSECLHPDRREFVVRGTELGSRID